MRQIQGKLVLLRVSGEFELPRVQVIRVQLYITVFRDMKLLSKKLCSASNISLGKCKDTNTAISPGFCIQESLGLPWVFFFGGGGSH